MFERFTEKARQAVVLAQEEARALNHNYIGTEHLLLGLLREPEGLAVRVLGSLGVTLEYVRIRVEEVVGRGEAENVTTGQIPFTPRAKKALELALRESLSLGHNYIGTEHILLALARADDGVAAGVLRDFGTDPEKIRDEVVRMLGNVPRGAIQVRRSRFARARRGPVSLILAGWLLFAAALGIGILIGWGIWGH